MFLLPFRSLSRQQKIDLCAQCHSGNKNILLKSRFAFRMGDTLSSYMIPIPGGNQPDVHGNQTQLLSQSKCYRMSSMDCTTCHNTHVTERGNTILYNAHCQSCHTAGNHFCKIANDSNLALIKNNCTRCHMPELASTVIRVQASANSTLATPTLVVSHRIAIYPGETSKVFKTLASEKTAR